jgi:predicted ATP-grasp superfamily ATP-dependent carboligase
VVGGYVNGLGLVRALAARGVRTVVIRTKPYDIAHHSRWVSGPESLPRLEEDPDLLAELLERRSSQRNGWAVFPTNDEALAALARHHDRLSSRFRLVAPQPEVARIFLDKELMLEAASAVGMDVPRCYGAAVPAAANREDLRFPIVVKPLVSYRFFTRFGAKLFVAADRAELSECIARLDEAKIPGRVFDLVPGPDSRIYVYCTYVDGRGEPLGGAMVHKLRQSPPLFGVARVAEVVPDDPSLREATIELLRRIGFRGFAAAEFKLDPRDGRFRFLEVNGRSVVYNGLLRQAGFDLAALAFADYVEQAPQRASPNGWPGAWIHLHADLLYSTVHRRGEPGLAGFVAPYRRPNVEAVWSSRDPRPFLAQWSRTAHEGFSALWQGSHRELLADRTRPTTP